MNRIDAGTLFMLSRMSAISLDIAYDIIESYIYDVKGATVSLKRLQHIQPADVQKFEQMITIATNYYSIR